MPQKVLVTGGAGFIGSHVAEAYVKKGARVWIVDDLSSGRPANVPDGARLVQLDIRDARLADVFTEARGFDIISHHAAQIDVRVSVSDPRRDAGVNIDGFLNVAECGLRFGCGRFMFVSSGGVVYGEPDIRPTPETTPKRPLSPYGVTKLSGEYYLNYYAHERGLDYAAVRYSNVYGPRQDPHGEAGVVAIFTGVLLAGGRPRVFGDGRQTRDYVFVADVVAALLAALDSERLGVYNVGTGIETDVLDLGARLAAACDREFDPEMAPARPGEAQRISISSALAERELGWRPASDLADGLRVTAESIRAARPSA